MSESRINTILLGHNNVLQRKIWKNDIHYANSFRDTIRADLPKHDDCLKSAYYNILAFLKNAETRGHSECRQLCEQIIRKDPQNINAHLQLYDISSSKEEKKKIRKIIEDIITSVSRDHYIGVALIELGVALSALIPKYHEEDTRDKYDDELGALFDKFKFLEFQSDVTDLDIPWRDEIDDCGLFNHETKNVYRWYNAVIYQKEGLYRLKKSHVVSASELEIYRFSLAQSSNRLSGKLFNTVGADYQRDHYSEASMKGFCEVVNTLDHARYGFYVCRSLAYLGVMIQKKKYIERASVSPPDCFRRLVDLERIWNNPEEAYKIAGERFEPDIVVCTRYGKFLVNAGRYDEALLELQKTTQLSPCEKWFPTYVKMTAYFHKYIEERDQCQSLGEPLSLKAKEFLKGVLECGSICKGGQSPMKALYQYSKALFWDGTEFSPPHNIVVIDDVKVKDALDVIKMIYEEYKNQDLTKVYKLHAECSKSLGLLEDSLHYMVCSFNASRRASETVLPSFKYLCLYGLGLSQSSDVSERTKTMALRHVKFAIEDEIRFCHSLLRDSEDATSKDLDKTIVQNILDENISGSLCKEIGALDYPVFKRWYSIYKMVRKLSSDFPEEMKLLLEYIHQKFVFTYGTQTLKILTLVCLGKEHKSWKRQYNNSYPHSVNLFNFRDINLFFKPSSSFHQGNAKAVCTEFEYDFCVIHSHHEQDFVACHLRVELEEGLEKFKGCIFERDAPRCHSVDEFLKNALAKSKRIIIVISSFFLSNTMSRLEPVFKSFKEMENRIITIKVEAIEEDDRFRWLFGDIIDGTTYPVNWRILRSRLLEDLPSQISDTDKLDEATQSDTVLYSRSKHSRPIGNYSSMLRSMKQLKLGGEGENELPCYKMDARPRGIALIINNIQFHTQSASDGSLQPRKGAHIDKARLEKLWTSLHFKTTIKQNLSKNEMEQELKSIADTSHKNYDCLVVCLLSHGDLGKVYGVDCEPLDIDVIQSYFYANKCPSLAGKPKLFFIQACQGRNTQTGLTVETDGSISDAWESDGPGDRKTVIHDRADFLTGFSTTPGDISARSENNGSRYISVLCHLMEKYVKRQDLLSILTVVNQQVSEMNLKNDSGDPVLKQVPNPRYTLTKKVVFR